MRLIKKRIISLFLLISFAHANHIRWQGDYKKAKLYYERADNLISEPVEAVSVAYNRINSAINEHRITTQQMNR